jgi:16S rRNA (cytidine1402-2'-O)-methyltransferase
VASPSGKAGACKAPILSSNLSATFFVQPGPLLYLISTPIGHLDDFSKRAIATLELSDFILCEDTRRSSILLNRYGIKKKLISYHKFNEKKNLEDLLCDLASGLNISLISDAGTPCINDPGLLLVQACIEKKIPFTLIPGPCSPILALVLSGMSTDRFQYIGFLPKTGSKTVKQALNYPGTTIALESPSRLLETLQDIQKLDPERNLAIAREMTKTYEECLRGTGGELLAHFKDKEPKGEIVLVIEGGILPQENLSLEECIEMLQELHGLSLKEAIKTAAKLKKIPKRDAYKYIHDC